MNTFFYRYILCSLIIVSPSVHGKQHKQAVTLASINAITMRLVDYADPCAQELSIDHLVASINKNKMPQKAVIPTIPSTPAPYIAMSQGVTTTQHDKVVVVFSRGYARTNTIGKNENFLQRGGCAMAAYWPMRDGIIPHNVPCVVFDYPDDWKQLNLGQEDDQECLELVINAVLENNPDATIILMGDCRGAKTALAYVVKHPGNVAGLVLFSPFVSVKDLTAQIARSYIFWLPKSRSLLFKLFKLCLPNYNDAEDPRYDHLSTIDPELPIFIGHRNTDKLIGNDHIATLVEELQQSGNQKVTFLAVNDRSAPHSKLTTNREIQRGVNLFLKKHDFPYNSTHL